MRTRRRPGCGFGTPGAPWSPRPSGASGALRGAATGALAAGPWLPLRARGRVRRRRRRVVDRYTLPVGIRTVRVEGTQLPHQRRALLLPGLRHARGPATSTAGVTTTPQWSTTSRCSRGSGANSFRTSHYPYAEEVLDQADRLGIVVIDETAAVGLNLGVGGGCSSADRRRRSPRRRSAPPRSTCTARRSRSSSPGTRTIRASSSGASPTSPSRTPRPPARTSSPCSSRAEGGPEPPGRVRQHDVRTPRHLHGDRSWPTSS